MIRKLVYSLLILAVLASLAVAGGWFFLKNYANQAGPLNQEITVVVPKGTGAAGIIDLLERAEVIGQPLLFKAYVWTQKAHTSFKAGEYYFRKGITPRQVVSSLQSGQSVTRSLTIPEGFMLADIIARLEAEDKLTGEVPKGIKEGELLPDTYFFLRGDTRKSMVKRMRKAMKKTLDSAWKQRQKDLPLKSKEEALTLASIVEKETGVKAERTRVAGVFINRLRKGMKLQSDPTTLYGVYQATGKRKKTLTRSELRGANAYNTYHIPALPPHPIASPGKAAILAVLNPEETDDLFFVATGTGGHRFAATLKGHKQNVALYRKWQRENGLR